VQLGSDIREQDILRRVREAADKRILFLSHAVSQMNSPDRMISTQEVRAVVLHGVVIEEYAEDVRGPSCLMLGCGEAGRPVHVVCAPRSDYLAIITTYLPSPEQWGSDCRTRKKR